MLNSNVQTFSGYAGMTTNAPRARFLGLVTAHHCFTDKPPENRATMIARRGVTTTGMLRKALPQRRIGAATECVSPNAYDPGTVTTLSTNLALFVKEVHPSRGPAHSPI